MDLEPTITVSLSPKQIRKAANKVRYACPDATVHELAKEMVEHKKNKVKRFTASRAKFTDTGLEVRDFKAAVSMRFMVGDEEYIVLVTGDLINFSRDCYETARKVLEIANES